MTAILAEPAAIVVTAEEYEALPPHPRAELVDGVLHFMTPPTLRHQRVVSGLERALEECCPDDLFTAREQDLYLGDVHRRNPDVMVVRREAEDLDNNTFRPRDVLLAAEVVSPTSQTVDRFHKPVEYARAGVPHYWRVETRPVLAVVTYRLTGGGYEETGEFLVGQSVRAPGLEWARVDVAALRPTR